MEINDDFLDSGAKLLLSAFFIYRDASRFTKKDVDEFFISTMQKYDLSRSAWLFIISSIRYHLYSELRSVLFVIFSNLDSQIKKEMYKDKGHLMEIISYEFKKQRLFIKIPVLNRISEDYFNFIDHDIILSCDERYDRYNIIESYILDYMNYVNDLLLTVIYDFNNKRKRKRGAINNNVELKDKVFKIADLTVKKIPNLSNYRLAKAIQRHFSGNKKTVSYNTYLAWVKECRKEMGAEYESDDTYKKSFSLEGTEFFS
ncbi:hypothetical protein H8B49_002616 [Salmonella enterica]|nr:hypothetical protein [Salmonella enterica]EIK4584151.1 hypothetical protein [Salmonella enterica]